MKTAIVTTTIHIPRNLESYLANFATWGHRDVEIIVVGDRKTPPEIGNYLHALQSQTGYPISYWDVEWQRGWLKNFPRLDGVLPYDSIQRRNLGYLQAVAGGAERIISIDDDNYAMAEDYLGGHAIVGQVTSLPTVTSSTGWFNTGSLLETSPPKPLYHRGFPNSVRGMAEELTYSNVEGRIVANVGLWLGVPDAPATCHLDCPVTVRGFRRGFDGRLVVARGTNLAFNSQNTAFHRDLLPCMFLIPMGDRVGDLKVGRYDDIWMSFFVKIIADHLGDYVCVGIPLSRQDRNAHDLIEDLLQEIPGMRITDTLIRTLARVRLSSGDYYSGYLELVEQLRLAIPDDDYTPAEREFLETMLDRMEIWAGASQEVAAGKL